MYYDRPNWTSLSLNTIINTYHLLYQLTEIMVLQSLPSDMQKCRDYNRCYGCLVRNGR